MSGRARARSRPASPPRIVAAPTKRGAARNSRLQVLIPDELLQNVRQLALLERKPVNVLVAEMLDAGINRRPRFKRLRQFIDELARERAAGDDAGDEAAA